MRRAAPFLTVLLFLVSCGLTEDPVKPGDVVQGKGGSSDDAISSMGGSVEKMMPPVVSFADCVDAAKSDRFDEEEATIICNKCLSSMSDECAEDPNDCFLRKCSDDLMCKCTQTKYCAEDALREAGLGQLLCEYRSTEEVSCPLAQQYCVGEGESLACFCNFFSPVVPGDCTQDVLFVCQDGRRDCFCSSFDLLSYDCAKHERWQEALLGVPQQCELVCPDDDLTAKECGCVCSDAP